jgi:hypothetical protein
MPILYQCGSITIEWCSASIGKPFLVRGVANPRTYRTFGDAISAAQIGS